jgi:hypothetical protein
MVARTSGCTFHELMMPAAGHIRAIAPALDYPGLQGAGYFIPTVLVPLLLIRHALVFRILL